MIRVVCALGLLAAVALTGGSALAFETLPDYDFPTGHFYTQTNGTSRGAAGGGYTLSDAGGIPFWSYFGQHGGVDVLGYPISQRFLWDGYVCQATQRAVLQWNPTTGEVQFANIFDYLSQNGRDDWLYSAHLAPRATVSTREQGAPAPASFLSLAHLRFAWLYADPAIFHRYFATPDYYSVFGLPTSPVEDLGPYQALRTQRAVLYHWKFSVPWADDHGVSVGLAGDLFKELGMIPTAALQPQTSPGDDSDLSRLPAMVSTKGSIVYASTSQKSSPIRVPAGPAPTATPTPKPSPSSIAANPAPVLAAPLPVATANSAPTQPARPPPAPAPAPATSGLPVLVGVATWYGADFQGQTMADGEAYDMYNPSIAAANVYPLGTLLRVTRLTTGESIVVRVTDHGAFQYPDLTDLSYAAFAQLADPASGVIGVQVSPVS